MSDIFSKQVAGKGCFIINLNNFAISPIIERSPAISNDIVIFVIIDFTCRNCCIFGIFAIVKELGFEITTLYSAKIQWIVKRKNRLKIGILNVSFINVIRASYIELPSGKNDIIFITPFCNAGFIIKSSNSGLDG